MEALRAALRRPLGAGVDKQRAGLELTAGVGRAAQVIVGEPAVRVGEEEGAADGLVAAEREGEREVLAETLGEREVVVGR